MNRIDQKFQELRQAKKKAFIAFLTTGDPSLKKTEELVHAFEKAGVDLIELGVPFSDPMADGPVIQEASYRALSNHVNLEKILALVKRIRKVSKIPLALMSYYNPIFHFGEKRFVELAKRSGVDGLIIPDLPPEEAASLIQLTKKNDMSLVFFLSPTTPADRIKIIAKASTGFIYYVSVTGITGSAQTFFHKMKDHIKLARKYTDTPVCIGFGVRTPQQVKSLSQFSDGVIVGSAIVNKIKESAHNKNMVSSVTRFVQTLRKPISHV